METFDGGEDRHGTPPERLFADTSPGSSEVSTGRLWVGRPTDVGRLSSHWHTPPHECRRCRGLGTTRSGTCLLSRKKVGSILKVLLSQGNNYIY